MRQGLVQLRRAGRVMRERVPVLPGGAQAGLRARHSAADGLSPEAALHASVNFRRGVYNGIMFTLVDALIAPTLVLAWFISRLGAPNVLVGLLPAILMGGWFLPQLIVASRVQGISRMMPWYSRTGVIRIVCMALLAVSTLTLAGSPFLLLVSFFFLYTLYSLGAGISGIPWLEVVSKVVSPRRRGSFFGYRNFWGGLLALLAAGPIGAILSEQLWGLTFPFNFAFLFAVTTVVVALGVFFWVTVREPEGIVAPATMSVRDIFRRGLSAFRSDTQYRAFMIARILLSMASIADPFYVVFAKERLGAPPATVGLYLGALSVSSLLSNFLWSPMADRASNRTTMLFTVLSYISVPLTALVVAFLPGIVPGDVLYPVFTLVFVLFGLATGAARIVNNNMLLTVAPAAERATYVGFLNTVLGVVIFVPVLGGLLVDLLGFEVVFTIALAVSVVSLVSIRSMSNRRLDA